MQILYVSELKQNLHYYLKYKIMQNILAKHSHNALSFSRH